MSKEKIFAKGSMPLLKTQGDHGMFLLGNCHWPARHATLPETQCVLLNGHGHEAQGAELLVCRPKCCRAFAGSPQSKQSRAARFAVVHRKAWPTLISFYRLGVQGATVCLSLQREYFDLAALDMTETPNNSGLI